MDHLLLVGGLVVFAFCILVQRHAVENAFILLSWFPGLIFLIAIAHELVRGIQQFNHQLLHVAYDSSYALSLIGICVVLRGVIKRKRVYFVLAATVVAGVPIGYIFIVHP